MTGHATGTLTISGQFYESQDTGTSITAQALDLTGDGHGHHVPGTPDVYSHGWKPLDGTEIGENGIRRPGKTVKPKLAEREVPSWIVGKPVMDQKRAAELAARMNKGGRLNESDLVEQSIAIGVHEWTYGYTQAEAAERHADINPDGPNNMSQLMYAVSQAPRNAPPLYRGLNASREFRHNAAQVKLIEAIAVAKPGDTVKSGNPTSWSADETVSHEFTGVVGRGVSPQYAGVLLRQEQGGQALRIDEHADARFAPQREWLAPPKNYTVVSNDPHPTVKGLRVITVRESA